MSHDQLDGKLKYRDPRVIKANFDFYDSSCASRLYWLHRCTQLLGVLLAWRLIMMRSTTARNLWLSLFSIVMRVVRMVPTHI